MSPPLEKTSGRPLLKGRTLKSGEGVGWLGIEGIRDFRDLKAEEGEKESVDFGVLDLKGLPAYAWVLRFIARVLFVRSAKF